MKFEGTLKEFELVSYVYDKKKAPLKEFEQRLSLNRDGTGRIVCYTYDSKEVCRDEKLSMDSHTASELLDLMGRYALEYDRSVLEWPDDNYGEWNFIMENTKGDLFRATGRLYADTPVFSRAVSNQLRHLTGLDFLAAFDGGAE